MTLQEISQKYNIAESSLKNAFPRSQKAIEKKYKVHIIKEGRGAAANYIEEPIVESDCRAMTLYNEIKDDIFFTEETAKLMNWEFLIFLAIIVTPMLVFRGSYEDFLRYAEIPINKTNINALKQGIAALEERKYIVVIYDEDCFTATLKRAIEKDMQINIKTIRLCKQIAEENHKRSWIPLLKTYIGITMAIKKNESNIIKMADICNLTGLSEYQIRESKKLLDGYDEYKLFTSKKVYLDTQICIGTQYNVNGFY